MEVPPLLRVRSTQILLLWLTIICSACFHVHVATASLSSLLRFMMGLVVGVTVVFLCHLSHWRRERILKEREAYTRQLMNIKKTDLFRLLPDSAATSAANKPEDQCNWMNMQLAKVWPSLNEAVADAVREKLQPILDGYKMGAVAEIIIQSLSFGVASPQFTGIKMEEMGEDEASLEADIHWTPEGEKIAFKVKTIGPDFKLKVKDITVKATAKLVLKPLADTMPCFGAILVSMKGMPLIDFELKVADGDANALPGVDKMMDNSIRSAVEDMLVWPNRIVCPVQPGDYSFLELKPVGILEVYLLKAKDVMNTDILGKSDCFALLFVRKKPERIKRSTTKRNTLNPVWNEGFKIEVDDPQYQCLTIQLMDEENVSSADYIGRAVVPLKELEPHTPKEMWLEMVEREDMESRKPRAQLQVVLVYAPFKKESSQSDAQDAANTDGGTRKMGDSPRNDPEPGREAGEGSIQGSSDSAAVEEEVGHKESHDLDAQETS